jgi:environmental stress-induced protein Ves
MPWRNGRGETVEMLRYPVAGSDFEWRISRAVIAEDGPFSDFSGYNRHLAILSGEGVELTFQSGKRTMLRPFDLAHFSGDDPILARLLDGPVEDFNVMIRRNFGSARVEIARDIKNRVMDCREGEVLLVYAASACRIVQEHGAPVDVPADGLLVVSAGESTRGSLSAAAALIITISKIPNG